jgi:flagellar M-ring protein FliF
VRKLSVSVLLDSKVASGVDPAQVQQMVTAAAGISTTRGDAVSVSALPFDTSATEQTSKELAQAGQADQQAQLMSMAKTGAMVLAVLVLLFLAWRASRKSKRSALSEDELAQLEEMQAALEASRGGRALEGAGSPLELGPGDAEAAQREQNEREGRRRELTDMVEEQPDEMANLLRGWLAERR